MNDLLIDTNERGPLINAVINRCDTRQPSVPHHREHLVVGDFIAGGCVIECKTIEDLIESSRSGHLWRQLENMDANVERGVILVWGDIAAYVAKIKNMSRSSKVSYTRASREVMSALARITADFGFATVRASNVLEASSFIVSLHDKLERPASRHSAYAVRRVSTNDARKDMLLTIPGFGHDMVENLLDKCGSIEEMLHRDALKDVPRMGKVLRNRLIQVLTSEEPVRVERTKK
mgnify:CR=1 FL=1